LEERVAVIAGSIGLVSDDAGTQAVFAMRLEPDSYGEYPGSLNHSLSLGAGGQADAFGSSAIQQVALGRDHHPHRPS